MDKINAPILEQAEKTESCPFCSWLIAAEMSIYRDDNYRASARSGAVIASLRL